jgi:ribonuclease HII
MGPKKQPPPLLERFYEPSKTKYEICIDEAGRGCLYGNVFIASVVLPKDEESFLGQDIKDSKKFSSKKKLNDVADYIKLHADYYKIISFDSDCIDKINILQTVMKGMHTCIRETIQHYQTVNPELTLDDFIALIDGNYFQPYCAFDNKREEIIELKHITFEKGDGRFMGIASAGILAKTARDSYVLKQCETYPELSSKYGLEKNMGYGTKLHLDGIKQYGITQWHRQSYGICKTSNINPIHEITQTTS